MTIRSSATDVFEAVYRDRVWGEGSGPGSLPASTGRYRALLEHVLHTCDIEAVLDVGCGDWAHSRLVVWGQARYHGIDVASGVVSENTRRFSRPGVSFECADVFSDFTWPAADLLVCKDVLQHWPNSRVLDFCADVLPRYPLALVTNDIASPSLTARDLNSDIPLGGWRTLDLEAAPFFLSPHRRLDYTIPDEETKRIYLFGGGAS